jgi:NAD(P)-dependent dehydrogenase (short-subunit alcohol dehydrogenase family)
VEIRGKVAVVTGAAHRVGKSIALALAEAGAHVVVHYHQASGAVTSTVGEIEQRGVRALAVSADLAQPAGAEIVFQAAEREFGGVDLLVNSAAIMETGNVLTLTPEAWQRTLDANLSNPFDCAQQAARSMIKRGGGAIVNIADLSSVQPWARYPAHSVSKAGVIMLTKVLAKALAPTIRVNAITAGPLIKPDDWPDARWELVGQHTLLKHTGSGYDVARAALFLLREDFITGATLMVDGGGSIV